MRPPGTFTERSTASSVNSRFTQLTEQPTSMKTFRQKSRLSVMSLSNQTSIQAATASTRPRLQETVAGWTGHHYCWQQSLPPSPPPTGGATRTATWTPTWTTTRTTTRTATWPTAATVSLSPQEAERGARSEVGAVAAMVLVTDLQTGRVGPAISSAAGLLIAARRDRQVTR